VDPLGGDRTLHPPSPPKNLSRATRSPLCLALRRLARATLGLLALPTHRPPARLPARPAQIDYFYKEQLHRMRCMGQEPVETADIVCQLFDLVKPPEPNKGIALRDLFRCSLAGKLFDVLFNLNKFLAWEAKDPHSIREERAQPRMTDWERFCRREYMRLALEDEPANETSDPMAWADVGCVLDGGSGGPGVLVNASGIRESPF
jgi:hypothetical protein